MEHTHETTDDHPLRIPRWIWMIGGGLLIALIAVVVFKVPLNTVATIGFFVLMMGSHLLMHGGHGDHSQHANPAPNDANTASTLDANSTAVTTQTTDRPTRHSGGCH